MIFQLGEFIFNGEFTPETIEHEYENALQPQQLANGGVKRNNAGWAEYTINLAFKLVPLDNLSVRQQFERLQEIEQSKQPSIYIDNDNLVVGYFFVESLTKSPLSIINNTTTELDVSMTLKRTVL